MMTSIEARHKIALDERLRTLEACPSGRFAGRGIVICVGGSALFTNAYILVYVLRNWLHCELPIEVWHFGSAELSARMASLLQTLDVVTVDATAELIGKPAAIEHGWQLKVYALMWSRFAEVLLLDADQVPSRDPACVFRWAAYRETGAILWPDIVDLIAQNPIWQTCGLEPRTVPSIESGQVLIDKVRHWAALQVTLHLNERAEFYYRLVYGDKDTWLLGLLLTRSPHAVVPFRAATDSSLCLYQRDFEGTILFQHRTCAKWSYAGAQVELPGFAALEACAEALSDLRGKWNGLVFNAPARTADALDVERLLSRQAGFSFIVPGRSPERLELWPDGEIGAGRAADRLNWYCEEASGAVHLVLCDAYGPCWRLARQANGRWYGQSLADQDIEAYLAADARASEAEPEKLASVIRPLWPMPGRYSSFDDAEA
jgi:hypothetical protein